MIYTLRVNIPTRRELQSSWSDLKNQIEKRYLQIEDKIFSFLGLWFWKLMYKLTGNCGSKISSHIPVFANTHKTLWKIKKSKGISVATCSICGSKIAIKKGYPTDSMQIEMREVREQDTKELQRMYKKATNEAERIAIKKSLYKINHESKEAKNMRESLIKATRNQDHEKIKDIHHDVVGKDRYTNVG